MPQPVGPPAFQLELPAAQVPVSPALERPWALPLLFLWASLLCLVGLLHLASWLAVGEPQGLSDGGFASPMRSWLIMAAVFQLCFFAYARTFLTSWRTPLTELVGALVLVMFTSVMASDQLASLAGDESSAAALSAEDLAWRMTEASHPLMVCLAIGGLLLLPWLPFGLVCAVRRVRRARLDREISSLDSAIATVVGGIGVLFLVSAFRSAQWDALSHDLLRVPLDRVLVRQAFWLDGQKPGFVVVGTLVALVLGTSVWRPRWARPSRFDAVLLVVAGALLVATAWSTSDLPDRRRETWLSIASQVPQPPADIHLPRGKRGQVAYAGGPVVFLDEAAPALGLLERGVGVQPALGLASPGRGPAQSNRAFAAGLTPPLPEVSSLRYEVYGPRLGTWPEAVIELDDDAVAAWPPPPEERGLAVVLTLDEHDTVGRAAAAMAQADAAGWPVLQLASAEVSIASCACWYGTASGNDPRAHVDLRLCPNQDPTDVVGEIRWLSETRGTHLRRVQGERHQDRISLHDVEITHVTPREGSRLCLIDTYRLGRSPWDKSGRVVLQGRFRSSECRERGALDLDPVECPADWSGPQ